MSSQIQNLPNVIMALAAWLFLLTAIFVPLERLFAVNRQSVLRPGLLADLGFFFLSGILPTLFLSVPMAILAALARELLPHGYFDFIAALPVILQIGGALVIGEIGFYWSHRAMHGIPFLWQFHAIHHEPERMDWLINTRMHPVDLIFTRMGGLALVAIFGFGSPGSGTSSYIPIFVLFAGTVWAFYIHSNVRWRLGWFEHVLSTPRFHHWHHSRDDHPNRNFASMLPIFDRLFGTLHMPGKAWPPSYGIAPENSPHNAADGPVKADQLPL